LKALRRTISEYREDNLSDWAAALTYYALLSLFPAFIVLVALLGLFGQHPRTTNAVLDVIRDIGPSSAVDTFKGTVEQVVKNKGGAGTLLGFGLVASLWSASGYIGAFMRASNVIYEVEEGRPFWKKRPLQLVVTLAMVLLLAVVALSIVLTGPLAKSIGKHIGVQGATLTVWSIAKWPVLLAMVVTMISILYFAAPNVRHPGFRWITPGGILAVVVWIVASLGFGFYVANFGSYNNTYGALGGVVIFLVWLYLTNSAVLLGAEFNAEVERQRELRAGLPAEDELQLPPRDDCKSRGRRKRSAPPAREGSAPSTAR
jgi:membrane protein